MYSLRHGEGTDAVGDLYYMRGTVAHSCYMYEHKGGTSSGSDGGVPWIVAKDYSKKRGVEGKRRNGSVISGELSG